MLGVMMSYRSQPQREILLSSIRKDDAVMPHIVAKLDDNCHKLPIAYFFLSSKIKQNAISHFDYPFDIIAMILPMKYLVTYMNGC